MVAIASRTASRLLVHAAMRILSLVAVSALTAAAHADPDASPAAPLRTTLSTDPIGAMHESYSLSVAHMVHPRFALRADVQLTPDSAAPYGGPQQLGVSVPIYFHAPFQGPFVEPGVFVRGLGCLGFPCETSTTVAGPSMAVGWQTTLGSGFTIAGALGTGRIWTSSPVGRIGNVPMTYLRVGYAW